MATLISLGVVFAVQWLEYDRSRNANGVVLFYWLLLLIAYAVKLRSLVSQQLYEKNIAYFIAYICGFGLSAVEFSFEWLWPERPGAYEAILDEDGVECPVEYATVFSRLTFSWMTPMMKFGYKQFITEEDLWGLSRDGTTRATGDRFQRTWEYELAHQKKPRIWIALFKAYGLHYLGASGFKFVNDLAAFTQPQLLRLLISFVHSYGGGENPQPPIKGAAIAIAMFFVATLQTTMVVSFIS